MKYALLVYGHESWDRLPVEQKRNLHRAQRALHEEVQGSTAASASIIAHYRLRPPEQTTTLRLVGDEVTRTDGPSSAARECLRALYLLESDDPDAVFDIAIRLPAVGIGGIVEIWPLSEPDPHAG